MNKSIGQRNIGAITSNQDVDENIATKTMRRTMLIKKLNTNRCTTAQELAKRFELLFETCLANGFIPPIEALALCSGYNRRTIHDIEVGNTHKGDGMSDIIKEAKDFIATCEAQLALTGEINSTTYIFRAKNFYEMSDRQEVVVTPNVENKIPDNVDDIINSIPQLKEGSQE